MVMYLGSKTTGPELIEIRVLILSLGDKADFQEGGIVMGRILSSPSLENIGPILIAHGKGHRFILSMREDPRVTWAR